MASRISGQNEYPLIESTRPGEQSRETYEGTNALLLECPAVGWARFDRASAHLGAHTHSDSYEICYIVRGSVEWWAGSQIFQVGPRDIYITRPGEAHGGVDAFMHPCELYWIHVRPRNEFLSGLEQLRFRHFPGGPILAHHFERLLAEHRSFQTSESESRIIQEMRVLENRRNAAIASRAALRLLVLDTMRFYQAALQQDAPLAAPSPQIAAAMQWIHRHFDDASCLAQAIDASGLRGTQFRKRFLTETGFTPHDYLMRAQIQEAKRRLAQTREPVTELAFDLGFSSSQYFATAFRRLVGLTPQTYRRYHAVGCGVTESK